MATAVLKVRGKELPKPWAERIEASIDTEVEVLLTTKNTQHENLKTRLQHSLAEAGRKRAASDFKIKDDPIYSLGDNPDEDEIIDGAVNHDKYLYQGR